MGKEEREKREREVNTKHLRQCVKYVISDIINSIRKINKIYNILYL